MATAVLSAHVRPKAAEAAWFEQAVVLRRRVLSKSVQSPGINVGIAIVLVSAHAYMQAAEAAWFEREGALRREVAAQEERLRSLEAQKAELAAASADGTRPLLRCVGVC